VHLAGDPYATHKTDTIQRWLAAHPRFQVPFVPTSSSWVNQVERWFAELTIGCSNGVSTPASRHLQPTSAPGSQRTPSYARN
jgi:hypothetical protein